MFRMIKTKPTRPLPVDSTLRGTQERRGDPEKKTEPPAVIQSMRVPQELMIGILQYCKTREILDFGLTSRATQAEAERLLYEHVEIHNPNAYVRFVLTILEDVQWHDSRRANSVRSLTFALYLGHRIRASKLRVELPNPLKYLSNLSHVRLGAYTKKDVDDDDDDGFVLGVVLLPHPPFVLRGLSLSSINDLSQLSRVLQAHIQLHSLEVHFDYSGTRPLREGDCGGHNSLVKLTIALDCLHLIKHFNFPALRTVVTRTYGLDGMLWAPFTWHGVTSLTLSMEGAGSDWHDRNGTLLLRDLGKTFPSLSDFTVLLDPSPTPYHAPVKDKAWLRDRAQELSDVIAEKFITSALHDDFPSIQRLFVRCPDAEFSKQIGL